MKIVLYFVISLYFVLILSKLYVYKYRRDNNSVMWFQCWWRWRQMMSLLNGVIMMMISLPERACIHIMNSCFCSHHIKINTKIIYYNRLSQYLRPENGFSTFNDNNDDDYDDDEQRQKCTFQPKMACTRKRAHTVRWKSMHKSSWNQFLPWVYCKMRDV